MATKIQLRRGTKADWEDANPLLAEGEPGYEEGTGKLKIGDGTRSWVDLPVIEGGSSSGGQVEADIEALDERVTQVESDLPHKTSELENDSGFITAAEVPLTDKADLVDGKVPAAQIPDLALSQFLGNVANENAMLALEGESGDWCVRTDNSTTYLLAGDSSVLADWCALSGATVTKTSELENDSGFITAADIPEQPGGGGATELNDLTDVSIAGGIPFFVWGAEEGETLPVAVQNPASYQMGGGIIDDETLARTGKRVWKETKLYGGAYGFNKVWTAPNRPYDVWSFWLYSPTTELNTTYRQSLGGAAKTTLETGKGWTIYTRDTGFSFYANGSYEEIGTRPALPAGQWINFSVQLNWYQGREAPPQVSIWVDGQNCCSAVTPDCTVAAWGDTAENKLLQQKFVWASTATGNDAGNFDRYIDDLSVAQFAVPPVAMDATTIDVSAFEAAVRAETVPIPQSSTLCFDGDQWVPSSYLVQPSLQLSDLINVQTPASNVGFSLDIDDLDQISFTSTDAKPGTSKIYLNSSNGLGIAQYGTETNEGAYVNVSYESGVKIRVPNSSPVVNLTSPGGAIPILGFKKTDDYRTTGNGLYLQPAEEGWDESLTIYRLPHDGSNGDVLHTNGSGELYWTGPSGGGGLPTPQVLGATNVPSLEGDGGSDGNDVTHLSVDLPIPQQASEGCLLVASVHSRSAITATPTGWTLHSENAPATSGSGSRITVFTKTAEAGDAGSAVTFTQTVETAVGGQIFALNEGAIETITSASALYWAEGESKPDDLNKASINTLGQRQNLLSAFWNWASSGTEKWSIDYGTQVGEDAVSARTGGAYGTNAALATVEHTAVQSGAGFADTWLFNIIVKSTLIPSGSGGGGAVESVNGETGTVSLGIQEMDDFSLNEPSGNSHSFTGGNTAGASGLGETQWGTGGSNSSSFFTYCDTGDHVSDFNGLQVGDAIEFVFNNGGGAVHSTTVTQADSSNGGNSRFIRCENSWPGIASTATGVIVRSLDFVNDGAPLPLTEGDILQWVDAEQKFKPAQLPAGGGAVDSVNGQTGVVEIGVEQLDNFALVQAGAGSQPWTWGPNTPSPEAGNVGLWSGIGYAISTITSDGTDLSAEIYGLSGANDPLVPVKVFVNSVLAYDGTWGNFQNTNSNRATFIWGENAWTSSIGQGDSIVIESDAFPGATYFSVAEGNILIYNEATQKWNPQQIPVNSVNGETGTVSLGIKEMDDFGLNLAAVSLQINYNVNLGGGSYGTPNQGEYSYGAQTSYCYFAVSKFDKDGVDRSADLNAWAAASPRYVVVDGVTLEAADADGYPSPSVGSNGLTMYVEKNGTSLFADTIAASSSITLQDAAGNLVPLANGDILQWVDADQKFKPAQIAAGGAVESVNNETGVVSLGVQDMDDFNYNLSGSVYSGLTSKVNSLGSATLDKKDEWTSGSNALFVLPDAWNQGIELGQTLTLQLEGSETVHTYTVENITPNHGGNNCTAFRFESYVDSEINNAADGNTLLVGGLDQETLPLAEGDILQWNYVDQKFKPAQPAEAPSKVSELDNDAGFITAADLPSSPENAVTQINAGENITISPAGGTGAVTINATGGGDASGGGSVRSTQSGTTESLAPGASANGGLNLGSGGNFISVQFNAPGTIVVYSSETARDLDEARDPAYQNPRPGDGVLLEVKAQEASTQFITPMVGYFTEEVGVLLPVRIINSGESAAAITVSVTALVRQGLLSTSDLLTDEEGGSNIFELTRKTKGDDPHFENAWDAYKAMRGWPDDYVPVQKDVNYFFDECDALQQDEIYAIEGRIEALEAAPAGESFDDSTINARLDALEARPEGIQHAISDDQQYVSRNGEWAALDLDAPMHLEFKYGGDTYYPNDMEQGELWGHKQDKKVYFSHTDTNGLSTAPFITGVAKAGTPMLITKSKDRSVWKYFTCDGNSNEQSWGLELSATLINGSDAVIEEGAEITVMFNCDSFGRPLPLTSVAPEISDSVVQELRTALAHEQEQRRALEQKLKLVIDALGRGAKGKLKDLFPEEGAET